MGAGRQIEFFMIVIFVIIQQEKAGREGEGKR